MNDEPTPGSESPVPAAPETPSGEGGLPRPFSQRTYLITAAIMFVAAYALSKLERRRGTWYFHYVLAGFFGAAMILAGPLVALSVYFFTTLAGGIVLPGIPFSINQAVGFGVLVAWGLWIVAGRTSWPGGWYVWLLVGSSVYFVANAVLGEDPAAGLVFAKYIALYELLGFVLLTSLRRPAHWTFWFWMILLFTFLNGLVGLTEFVTRLDIFPGGRWIVVPLSPPRANGLSQNAIMYSYNALWAFGPGLYLSLHDRTYWRRVLAGIMTFIILAAAFLSLNRQTPINAFVMLIAATLVLRHRMVRPLAIFLTLAALVASPFIVSRMGARFTHAGEVVKDPSYALRHDKLRIMKEMIREKPITGVGLGSFPTVWEQYLPDNLWFLSGKRPVLQYPDMGYMQMLSESGIIGFTLDVVILLAGFRLLWRRRRRAVETGNLAVVNLCGILVMLIVQLVMKQFLQDVFFFARSWWLFAMIVVVSAYTDEQLVGAPPPRDQEPGPSAARDGADSANPIGNAGPKVTALPGSPSTAGPGPALPASPEA